MGKDKSQYPFKQSPQIQQDPDLALGDDSQTSSAHQELATSAKGEPTCVDARNEPSQADIEHLCNVWAEVGRAILTRRQQTNGEEELTDEGSSLS